MRTFRLCSFVALAVALLAGCGTTGGLSEPKPQPVDSLELHQQADGMLDYLDGKSAALPQSLLEGVPLANENDDTVKKLMDVSAMMREGADEIAALKSRGVLGEDNRGYLVLRNNDRIVDAAEKNVLQKVMATENDLRKEFYRAMARTREERGLTLTRVERVFAARRIARATQGSIVQLPSDKAEFELLRSTPLAKTMGDAFQPGAWVEIP